MQVNHIYVVRTPYTKIQSATYREAIRYFQQRGLEMGIQLVWRKGKGCQDDPQRYHFWEIENEQDAHAFFLACGDQIQSQYGSVRNT